MGDIMPKSKKKSNSKKSEAEKPKVSKHPGYECLYLGDKELTGYGFKTGDGLLDVAPFKILSKNMIIEEIDFKGAMCAFHPFKSVIAEYPIDDILFVWDPDEIKEAECNFYFCSTTEQFEAEKIKCGITGDGKTMMNAEDMQKKKEEEEKERQRIAMEEEEKKEKERIAAAIEKLKQPLIASGNWKDLGSYDEIKNLKIKSLRSRIRISISRKRRHFGANLQFSDQENVNGMNIEIKSMQTRNGYDVYSKLTDKCIQSGNSLQSKSTQTKFRRKVNKIIQYEFNEQSIQKQATKQKCLMIMMM